MINSKDGCFGLEDPRVLYSSDLVNVIYLTEKQKRLFPVLSLINAGLVVPERNDRIYYKLVYFELTQFVIKKFGSSFVGDVLNGKYVITGSRKRPD